ncbi:hypothetical protein Plec18170_000909 [Paecilomyces lecythidis]
MEQEEDVKVPLESHSSPEESKPNADSSESHEAVPKNVPGPRGPKKRTKTGCLTCRKRRIKCGEEKPICNNCIKSKRECEGYAQRVIFKHPLGPFGGFQAGPPGSHLHQPAMRLPLYSDYNAQYAQYAQSQSQPGGSQHPLLAPRPVYLPPTGAAGQINPGAIPQQPVGQAVNSMPLYYPTALSTPQTQGFPQPQNFVAPQPVPTTTEMTSSIAVNDGYQDAFAVSSSYQPFFDQQQIPEITASGSSHINLNQGDVSHQFEQGYLSNTVRWDPTPNSQMNMAQTQAEVLSGEQVVIGDSPEVSLHPKNLSPSQILSPSSGYNDESDDHYDVDSDEEMSGQTQIENFNQLNLIMASARQDERLRSFTTHLNEPNVLASYRPSMGSSPLNNPKTARIFLHFIHSTGPSISIWERHPTNASIRLGAVIPPAHQGLWTYTLPLQALEHPALLQAILAISSLHIAKLQDAPPTVSLKHYHYALKKVGAAVGLPVRRKQIATLAATLLLGFYEVTAAEHHKWNSHVAGSAQLIREIDFAGLTRDLRAHRRRVRAQREQMAQMETWPWYDQLGGASEDDPFCEKESEVDENLVGSLMGRVINYDQFGRIEDGREAASPKKHFTKKDIENYRIQSDLYWWYTKQDLFQSLISGNSLFTPYDQWGQCPPRAGIGRLDAVYGSMDHLILLLGRLADFAYRDRKRKVRSLTTTGGEWRPTPEFFKFMARFGPKSRQPNGGANGAATGAAPTDFPHGPSGVRPPHPSDQQNRLREDPPMYGMVPQTGPVRLPSAFIPTGRGTGVVAGDSEDSDTAETPYHEAEAEWEDIGAALDLFVGSLGPEYMPLSPDIATPIATPFGPALQYRTHTIAVLWAYYYLGRILLNRLHPCMPPATMVAAGVAASTTAEAAQTVGKIMAGIYHPQQYNFEAGSLNPTLGGALTEVTVPVFFAGVQYMDAAQRGWTVSKLTEIFRLTGWQTSFSIAVGCESAWVAAAKKGRGPPYEFTTRKELNKPENDVHDTYPSTAQRPNPDNNTELRFTTPSTKERLHFAQGLLGLEEDILTLEIEDRV